MQKKNSFQPRSLALRECSILTALLFALALALHFFPIFSQLDQTLYDHFLQSQSRPARDDILIVAIDDYSLAELGKWPWPRARHAELIRRINAAKPLAIGVDILFSEPETVTMLEPDGDQQLAFAIAEKSNVVLPLVLQNAGKGLSLAPPLPALAQAASQLGHIHVELDTDGVARSVFLREGLDASGANWRPHFALALRDVGQSKTSLVNTAANFPGTLSAPPLRSTPSPQTRTSWQRDWRMLIPFYGSSGHFTSVPYVAVLRGEVPAEFFKNKYVLIGPTAVGMADAFPTPVTSNEGSISGIEINANVLASLLDGRSILPVKVWQAALLNLLLIAGALSSFLLFSPRTALATVTSLIVGMLLLSFGLLGAGFWLAPASCVLVLIIAYPLWSWRRLETAIGFLGEEFILLDQEPHLLPEYNHDQTLGNGDEIPQFEQEIQDKLGRHINAMRSAAQRVRDLRQFVTDSLHSLPDATMVTSTDGNVLLSNPAAVAYFKSIGIPQIIDSLVPYLFANMSHPLAGYASERAAFTWWHLLDLAQTNLLIKGVEVIDPHERSIIIKSAPCYSGEKRLIGWIISLIDISEIRKAEKRREETLHFISHDMRSPQTSILALIDLQKDPQTAIPNEDFVNRIEKASRSTLSLADSFVQLAQAEGNDYRFVEMDFRDILMDATEELWSLARNKQIKLQANTGTADYPVRVDRSLMTRVLTNLLSNAIKYSPSGTTITCTLAMETKSMSDTIVCSIQDQGYGIARADQGKLFQRFQRLNHANAEDKNKNEGIGLGMVFVKTVIDRHFAQISFVSEPGQGTCFTLRLAAHNY